MISLGWPPYSAPIAHDKSEFYKSSRAYMVASSALSKNHEHVSLAVAAALRYAAQHRRNWSTHVDYSEDNDDHRTGQATCHRNIVHRRLHRHRTWPRRLQGEAEPSGHRYPSPFVLLFIIVIIMPFFSWRSAYVVSSCVALPALGCQHGLLF